MKVVMSLALLGAVWSATAEAQTATEMETGSNIPIPRRARISDRPGITEADRARLAMADFARCSVDRMAPQVSKVLMLPADKLDGRAIAALADDECLASGEMKFKPLPFRGALFAELYRRRAAAEARRTVWRLPVTPFDPNAPVDTADKTLSLQIGLLDFAECVVDRDPATAKAVVVAPTASKAQDAAFATLTPNLGPCVAAGQKITLSRLVLEGALGEVLYRGIVPTGPSPAKEAK